MAARSADAGRRSQFRPNSPFSTFCTTVRTAVSTPATGFVLSGTQQLYAFMGLVLLSGLVLFLATRGDAGDALEAESYEASHAHDDEEPGTG